MEGKARMDKEEEGERRGWKGRKECIIGKKGKEGDGREGKNG